uniref:Uncharacterized protein n=1 Tax=Takifugu rubripes TaxID=31033 RepID=A0A674N2V3_TAKRU
MAKTCRILATIIPLWSIFLSFFECQNAQNAARGSGATGWPGLIYSIRTGTSEDPDDVGIVIEGMKVLTALGTFPRAGSMLVGLIYAGTLAYPKELRYTSEVFQKVLLELDCSKLSPKVNSLKNNNHWSQFIECI